MPWKETESMKERVKFVLEWEKRWEEGEGRQSFLYGGCASVSASSALSPASRSRTDDKSAFTAR
jgi:hypothetical protein